MIFPRGGAVGSFMWLPVPAAAALWPGQLSTMLLLAWSHTHCWHAVLCHTSSYSSSAMFAAAHMGPRRCHLDGLICFSDKLASFAVFKLSWELVC